MPLESDLHERTFMQWPARASIYGSMRALDAVRSKIALIAKSIARFEPVVVLARPEQVEAAAEGARSRHRGMAHQDRRFVVSGFGSDLRCLEFRKARGVRPWLQWLGQQAGPCR